MTATQLYAAALGRPCPGGGQRCFFCGGECGEEYPVARYRSDNFTAWSTVAAPASGYVCGGCVAATDESDRSRRPRFFSWAIDRDSARSFGKGDRDGLRACCVAPPAPPFALVIAVGGQKHLLYLAPVNRARGIVTVQFEDQRVNYRPAELVERLDLCARLCAASGRPALAGPPTAALAGQLAMYWTDFEPLLARWLSLWSEPLSRLAAHLVPKQEDCAREHPSDYSAPAAADVRRGPLPPRAGGTG